MIALPLAVIAAVLLTSYKMGYTVVSFIVKKIIGDDEIDEAKGLTQDVRFQPVPVKDKTVLTVEESDAWAEIVKKY